jgi:hypothetical protein
MKKKMLVILIILIASLSIGAVTFETTYGGALNDEASDVQQTSDGGYIVLGSSKSYGPSGWDIWLIKTDAEGVMEWEQSFGGQYRESGSSIYQTADGGYILGGNSESFGAGSYDGWIIKTDASGVMEWEQLIGGESWDIVKYIQQTTDGGYIAIGQTESYGLGGEDFWMTKLDANGTVIWSNTYGGSSDDIAYSGQQTSDGGYILAGKTESFGAEDRDIWLVKTDADGVLEWDAIFGGVNTEIAFDVQQTSDGGYIIAGETNSIGNGNYDVLLIKTDENGLQEWETTFGGADEDKAFGIQEIAEGGYILSCITKSYGAGIRDCWLIKTENDGTMLWDNIFGGTGNDSGREIATTTDGGFVIAGFTNSYGAGEDDCWLIKTDANGSVNPAPEIEVNPEEFVLEMSSNEIFTDQFTIMNISSGTIDYSIDVNYLSGNDWMTVDPEFGELEENETNIIEVTFNTTDLTEGLYQSEIVISYNSSEVIIPVSLTVSGTDINEDTIIAITKLIGNYPNPFNPTTTISFQINNQQNEQVELIIYNLKGQKVKRYEIRNWKSGMNEIVWSGDDDSGKPVASGIYYYKLKVGAYSQTKKMMLMK